MPLPTPDPTKDSWGQQLNDHINALEARIGMGHIAPDGAISAREHGVVGDGVADDSAALLAFFTRLRTNGGLGVIPPGTYRITQQLGASDGFKPFRIVGAGKHLTTIVRGADFAAPMVQFSRLSNFTLENLTIDGGAGAFPTNASHGLVALDSSNSMFRGIRVRDHKNTGILVYTTADFTYTGWLVDDCEIVGNGATTNNGIVLVDMEESSIRNSTARNILGSPGAGFGLKNNCRRSSIVNCYAENCDDGFNFGTDTLGKGCQFCYGTDLMAYDCNIGVASGESNNNTWRNILVDMRGKVTGFAALHLEDDSVDQSVTGLHVVNGTAGIVPVRVEGLGGTVEIDYIEHNGAADILVSMPASSSRSYVSVNRAVRAGTPVTTGTAIRTNAGTDNIFNFRGVNV